MRDTNLEHSRASAMVTNGAAIADIIRGPMKDW